MNSAELESCSESMQRPVVASISYTFSTAFKISRTKLSEFRHISNIPPHQSFTMGQRISSLPGIGRKQSSSKASAAQFDKPAEEDPDLWMLVGLGNPGPRYAHTRHNVGFMLIDALAKAEGITVNRIQENAQVGRGRLCGKKILLAKPMTFMNVSGESVGKLSRFYKVIRVS